MKAIEVENLTKIYQRDFRAVDNISFSVEEGEIFGLLGPNGAGKTTTIKMLITLTKSTFGSIEIFGIDAIRSSQAARALLGFVPQAVSVDGDLTAYENLLIFSKLFYVSKKDRSERIEEALEYMGLADRKNDLVKHFSGGMMRRLEIAQALVNRPRILFLDEPTIGLDPSSKRQVWNYIRQLNATYGTTILLTTHDMLEADELCNRICIMNLGRIAVSGSPDFLKKSVGGDIVKVKLSRPPTGILLPREIGAIIPTEEAEERTVRILTTNGENSIPRIIDFMESLGYTVESISLSRPSLDDVFMKYAKRNLVGEAGGMFKEARAVRRTFARHAGG